MLSVGSGCLDAVAFLALGKVFASVVTGNLVLLGLGGVRGDGTGAVHAGLACAGYVVGVAGGAVVTGRPGDHEPLWPPRALVALAAEGLVLVAVVSGWQLAGARPPGASQLLLLAGTSVAMGLQSAAVSRLRVPGFSTTYLTGTTTSAVTDLVAGRHEHLGVKGAVVAGVVAGAALGAGLLRAAPAVAPVPALAVVAVVLAGGSLLRRRAGGAPG